MPGGLTGARRHGTSLVVRMHDLPGYIVAAEAEPTP
jgi:hypothetical protein